MGLDRRRANQLNLDDAIEWETKTITSAVKTFFRNLPGVPISHLLDFLCQLFFSEPIMTFSLHSRFIEAAKCDSYSRRLSQVLSYVMMGHLAERHRQHTRNKSKTDFLDPPAGPAAAFPQPEDA